MTALGKACLNILYDFVWWKYEVYMFREWTGHVCDICWERFSTADVWQTTTTNDCWKHCATRGSEMRCFRRRLLFTTTTRYRDVASSWSSWNTSARFQLTTLQRCSDSIPMPTSGDVNESTLCYSLPLLVSAITSVDGNEKPKKNIC